MKLDKKMVEAAVYGGAVLGGGGGGWIPSGLEFGKLAFDYGQPTLLALKDIPTDAILITVAAVGAPAAKERFLKPRDYVRAVEMLIKMTDGNVGGIITNENGASTTVNGWLQSAVLGLPVVDAPCNGRAHPISTMGGMGLSRVDGYISKQAASGGNPETGKKLELTVEGNIHYCSNVIRNMAVEAGGLVAVARNPVSAEYVAKNGAPDAILQAIQLGEVMISERNKGAKKVIEATASFLQGEVATWGRVTSFALETKGGFDVGEVTIKDGDELFDLTFWNEYMTLESKGERIATFPDLIMTLSMEDATPLTTAMLKEGQEVAIIKTHRKNLKLGAGMFDKDLYRRVEDAVRKSILDHIYREGEELC